MSFALFLFYNSIVVPFLYLIYWLGGCGSQKIRKGRVGRKGLFSSLKTSVSGLDGRSPRIWIHASSMGEFEQIKPVIAALKARSKKITIILSFSSPSAYEHIGGYDDADVLTYLPVDSLWNARKFIKLVAPRIGIVVRHDIWPNHLRQLHRFGSTVILADAALSRRINPRSVAGRLLGALLYRHFDHVLAISESEAQRLSGLCGDAAIEIYGDTRYDQVYRRSLERERIADLLDGGAFDGRPVLVAGSTWQSDEERLLPALSRLLARYAETRVILVPHEPTEPTIARLENDLDDAGLRAVKLSDWPRRDEQFRVLLVDSIGLLANIYALGRVAYVGGSFGPGVHNVLEPAVYGIPVLFGPKMGNSHEAGELLRAGCGFKVTSSDELYRILDMFFSDEAQRQKAADIARHLVKAHMGTTDKTVALVENILK